MDVTEDPAGGVPGGIVGGGTGGYAGAEASFTGGAFAIASQLAESISDGLDYPLVALTHLSMQGLEPFLASCLSSQDLVTNTFEAGICLTLGTSYLPLQVFGSLQVFLHDTQEVLLANMFTSMGTGQF